MTLNKTTQLMSLSFDCVCVCAFIGVVVVVIIVITSVSLHHMNETKNHATTTQNLTK